MGSDHNLYLSSIQKMSVSYFTVMDLETLP